jgi:hypothetical protein
MLHYRRSYHSEVIEMFWQPSHLFCLTLAASLKESQGISEKKDLANFVKNSPFSIPCRKQFRLRRGVGIVRHRAEVR